MMTATEHDGGGGLAPVVDPPTSSYQRASRSSRDNAVAAWHWFISPPFKGGHRRMVFFGGGIFIFFIIFYLFAIYCVCMAIYSIRFVVLVGALLIWGLDSLLGVFHRRAEAKPAKKAIKMARKQTPLCG